MVIVFNMTSTKSYVALTEKLPFTSKENLWRAQNLFELGLKTASVIFDKEHPDETPSAPKFPRVLDQTLRPHDAILSVGVVLRPEVARAFLFCLASPCQSQLELVPQQGTTDPLSEWTYVRVLSDPRFANGLRIPLWQCVGQPPPPALPRARLRFFAAVFCGRIGPREVARRVRNTFSASHPVVKGIYDQTAGSKTLLLRGVVVEMDSRRAVHGDFGLTQQKTFGDGGVRQSPCAFDGAHYHKLSNGAICITLAGGGEEDGDPVTIPITLSDGGWLLLYSK
jgi:hypothetical protein